MNTDERRHWLHRSEVIDSLRVVPRLFLAACFTWTVWITHVLLTWYTTLAKEERGIEASGFGAIALSGVFAFLKLVFETYSRHGRDWNVSSSSSMETTTTKIEKTP